MMSTKNEIEEMFKVAQKLLPGITFDDVLDIPILKSSEEDSGTADTSNHITWDPYTHKSNIISDQDLCDGKDISDKTRILYNKYRIEVNSYLLGYWFNGIPCHIDDKRYYVYAWHTKTKPYKYFYIGKGVNRRWEHIVKEIDKYRSGAIHHSACSYNRYKKYSYLEEHYGIECDKALENVSDYEALIYEEALKIDMAHKGEVLLSMEGVPDSLWLNHWDTYKGDEPQIEIDKFFQRYDPDYHLPYFDKVNLENLSSVYFYDGHRNTNLYEKVKVYIDSINGHIFTSGTGKKVKAIIVFNSLPEERYRVFKEHGKEIYSAKELIDTIGK